MAIIDLFDDHMGKLVGHFVWHPVSWFIPVGLPARGPAIPLNDLLAKQDG